MSQIYYTEDHEWIAVDGPEATVGITEFAAQQLGDVVFVDLPQAGAALTKGKEAAVVESVKAASDVYAPVSGTVTVANATIADNPALVNEDPEGTGWFFKLVVTVPAELSGLLDRAKYDAFLATLD